MRSRCTTMGEHECKYAKPWATCIQACMHAARAGALAGMGRFALTPCMRGSQAPVLLCEMFMCGMCGSGQCCTAAGLPAIAPSRAAPHLHHPAEGVAVREEQRRLRQHLLRHQLLERACKPGSQRSRQQAARALRRLAAWASADTRKRTLARSPPLHQLS